MKGFLASPFLTTSKLLVTLGIVSSLTACDMLGLGEDKPQQAMQKRVPQVGVLTVKETTVPKTFSMTGRAEAYAVAEIRPQVEGIVTERLFKEGSLVKKGDMLYQLDDASYQALYENAKAAIARSKALLTNAQIKVSRNERLVKINAVSEQVLDDAKASLREAKANLAANQAALKTASINLERTQIKAPISGRIGRSSVTKGALVTTNQATSLATIQQLNPIYVDFSVPSNYAIILRKAMAKNGGQNEAQHEAHIVFEDGTKYEHTGKIRLSEFEVNRSTDAIILRTEFPNPDAVLLPGMFLHGNVITGYQNGVFLVPTLALQRDAVGNAFVMTLNSEGVVTVKPVKAQDLYEDKWIITEGLKAGDRVITKGLQYIRPGVKATIIGASKPKQDNSSNAKEGQ
ncbi:MAG: efflux RND transporter periplasmic adaptor subunit [Hydrogenovibrio crunogenus]|nr:efflux RND transporter periplasmic adaptor subunit [Hydrogenovibrio crunogenus]